MSDLKLNMLGSYESLVTEARRFEPPKEDAGTWKHQAREKMFHLLSPPDTGTPVSPRVQNTAVHNGLLIEELTWQLPFGPATSAVFLKPENAKEPLPGILGFHDHGGIKYFGRNKIVRTGPEQHPMMAAHQKEYYGGAAWANELARRGYGVLVHDVFTFESRKIVPSHLPALAVNRMMSDPLAVEELTPDDLASGDSVRDYDVSEHESLEEIKRFDAFAGRHEEIIAKALFSSGLTWPGVCFAEDLAALDYLCSREDIDGTRVGCCGLSGGGLRTNYLAGMDDRIRCSVTAGFMTTWNDLALNKCFTHTWMIYIPLLPVTMEFPEILGMRAPLPSLVLATEEDPLFTLEEVKQAASVLESIYRDAGGKEAFRFSLYSGPHKFDGPMQEEAFQWLDRWLKGA